MSNEIFRSVSQSTKIPGTTPTTDKLNRPTGYLSSSFLRNHTLDNHYLSNSDHPDLKAASLPRARHQQGFAKKLRRPRTAGTDITSTSSTFNQLYKPVIEVTHS
ncbi:hypothetical protein KEM48_004267 [Puccinia striiformis f. sp. tritici PST-130]|nr:hypothetical protein KEM48_004267 [Puccinia striiformis f. sp. tritici PST-130]